MLGMIFIGGAKSAANTNVKIEPQKAQAAEVVEPQNNSNIESPASAPTPPAPKPIAKTSNLGINIKTARPIDSEKLKAYLNSVGSPLAPYAEQITQSQYSSMIIGICWIEELKCTINPHGSNNFWGLMAKGKIISYPTIEAGIQAIDAFLAKAEANKRTTIESFRNWYCASECTNWESTVKKIKAVVEAL